MRFLWIFPILGSVIGALMILLTVASTSSAPQEAAGFALACAIAVVPYVLVRSIVAAGTPDVKSHVDKVLEALTRLER